MLGEEDEVVQEDLAEEGGGLDTGFGHTYRVELVYFGFEEAEDQGEEDFAEDGGPFVVIGGGKFGGLEGTLERGHGLVTDFSAGVYALDRKGVENWGPVSGPGFLTFEMGLLDEGGD